MKLLTVTKSLLLAALMLLLTVGFGQSDEINTKKYWKLRNSFKEKFIKIGDLAGESLPIGRRGPGDAVSNAGSGERHGTLDWGDGTIRHGHYLGFLATEYALLKKSNQDLTAIKNELYFALNALNRLDRTAENLITFHKPELTHIPGDILNGFYLRDDVPKDFEQHWADSKINAMATGGFYLNNNAAHIHDPSGPGGYVAEYPIRHHTQHWMTPSADQMTSLLVGLKVCHKLLEAGVVVKPRPSDPAMDLRAEVEAITHRLVSFAADHDWFLLDMKGWPVGNGGGDLALLAYPMSQIAQSITGNTYSLDIKRKLLGYFKAFEYDILPSAAAKTAAWDAMSLGDRLSVGAVLDHDAFGFPLSYPLSNFELWQSTGVSIDAAITAPTWHGMTATAWESLQDDWEDDNKFNTTFGAPLGWIPFKKINIFKDYNKTITFNSGVASGIFSSADAFNWGAYTGNWQLVLIDAVLKDGMPGGGSKAFFENILNSMPMTGSFKFHGWNGVGGAENLFWTDGWGGEYRWTHPGESVGPGGFHGQYSGMDYMYLHNLYNLVYDDVLPPVKEEYNCICSTDNLTGLTSSASYPVPAITPMATNDLLAMDPVPTIVDQMSYNFSFLEFCMPNAFEDVPMATLDTDFDLFQQFGDDYHDINIPLNKYQTETFTVEAGGELNIESRLVICETKTLLIENGGEVNLDKGEIRVNSYATLIIEGDLNAQAGTKIILDEHATLIIRGTGTLYNEGYIQIKDNASIEYEAGAELIMPTAEAEIHFDGGDLFIKDNATFEMEHDGYPYSGQLRFSRWGTHIFGAPNARFQLKGKNEMDPIIVIDKDADFLTDANFDFVKIDDGKVIMLENSRLSSIPAYFSNGVHYWSDVENRGLTLFRNSHIVHAEFEEVPIKAFLFYGLGRNLALYNSVVNSTIASNAIYVKGGSYIIGNSQIYSEGNYTVLSTDMTKKSRLYNSTLTAPTGMGSATNGVYDISSVEVVLSGNTFTNHYTAVIKRFGTLKMSCNNLNNFRFAGIYGSRDCKISMNSDTYSGYNTFVKAGTSGVNVRLDGARGIVLYDGYNTFDDTGYPAIIYGTIRPLFTYYTMSGSSNQWNLTDLSPPAPTFTDIRNELDGYSVVTVLPTTPASAACGAHNPSGGGIILGGGVATGNPASPVPFSFGLVLIDDAVGMATQQMESLNSNGSNLVAMSMFNEILMYNYQQPNPATLHALDEARDYMAQTLRDMLAAGTVSATGNNGFDPVVQSYVDVLNKQSMESVNGSNYARQFAVEMSKVHLFHMLEMRSTALQVLAHAETCGLMTAEQTQVNNWKKAIATEEAQIAYGYDAVFIDSSWVDTTQYLSGQQQSFGNFGSTIMSPTSIVFNSCTNNGNREAMISNPELVSIQLYPNPSHGTVHLATNIASGQNGEFVLYDLAGKKVHSALCARGEQTHTIDLNNLPVGMYVYSFFVDGHKQKEGKIIVQ